MQEVPLLYPPLGLAAALTSGARVFFWGGGLLGGQRCARTWKTWVSSTIFRVREAFPTSGKR